MSKLIPKNEPIFFAVKRFTNEGILINRGGAPQTYVFEEKVLNEKVKRKTIRFPPKHKGCYGVLYFGAGIINCKKCNQEFNSNAAPLATIGYQEVLEIFDISLVEVPTKMMQVSNGATMYTGTRPLSQKETFEWYYPKYIDNYKTISQEQLSEIEKCP